MSQESMPTSLLDIGKANLLRQMGNDQRNQAHAMAMGQAQMRQMMGDHYQPPTDDEMKIAGQGITETVNYHFYGTGKDGTEVPPVAAPALPSQPLPQPQSMAPAPEIAAATPSNSGSPARGRFRALVAKMAPLVLASTLGAGGIVLGQLVQSIMARTASHRPAADPPPKEATPPIQTPPIATPPKGPTWGPVIIQPERPEMMWELDLGKPSGSDSNGESNQNGMGQSEDGGW